MTPKKVWYCGYEEMAWGSCEPEECRRSHDRVETMEKWGCGWRLLINPDEGIWISCPHCGFSEGFEDEVPWQVIIHSCTARQPRFESEQMTNWNPPGPCPNCSDQHPTREEHWRCGECNTLFRKTK